MNAPNFAGLLDKAPTTVDKPKPLPVGTYLCVVDGLPRYDKSSKKQTDFVEFKLRPIQAADDVDADDLAAAGGLDKKSIRATFYLTEDAVYRLDEFHQHCGLELDPSTSRRQRNEMIVNANVMAYIKHRASDDGENVYAELSKTAKAD